jgi:hypothetical protein
VNAAKIERKLIQVGFICPTDASVTEFVQGKAKKSLKILGKMYASGVPCAFTTKQTLIV